MPQTLYHVLTICISPEYIQPLREEVESVITEQGWTRASLLSLRKMDSFLRESLRISGASTSELGSILDKFLAFI